MLKLLEMMVMMMVTKCYIFLYMVILVCTSILSKQAFELPIYFAENDESDTEEEVENAAEENHLAEKEEAEAVAAAAAPVGENKA